MTEHGHVPDLPCRLLTRMQLRVVLALRVAESWEAAPTYAEIGRLLEISDKAVRYHLNQVATVLDRVPGIPAKRRVFDWAKSPDGQTYLGKPHVAKRLGAESTEGHEPRHAA